MQSVKISSGLCILGLIVVLVGVGRVVEGAGECGSVSADMMALRMAPCIPASDDVLATPTSSCCSAVHTIGQSPPCLCAALLSNTTKMAGVKPEVAITIPKRCNIVDRPVGYKCGAYTLP